MGRLYYYKNDETGDIRGSEIKELDIRYGGIKYSLLKRKPRNYDKPIKKTKKVVTRKVATRDGIFRKTKSKIEPFNDDD